MNKRGILVILLFGGLCFIVYLVSNHAPEMTEHSASVGSNPAIRVDLTTNLPAPSATTPKTNFVSNPTQQFNPVIPQEPPSIFSLQSPIEFYGKVVDENGKPIDGVVVKLGRLDSSPDHYTETMTETDSEGEFSLTDVRGKSLDVRLEKNGYYYSRKENPVSFEYSNPYDVRYHRADPLHPVIFRLHKKGEAEPLLHFEKDIIVPRNGTPVRIDLITGKETPNGDLRVMYVSSREDVQGGKYDWNCTLEILDGGLVETLDEFMFEAPLEDYQAADTISMPRKSEGWRRDLSRRYFLKLNNGKYGRMEFRMITGRTDFFVIKCFINPTGSRNLEYDPAVQPYPYY